MHGLPTGRTGQAAALGLTVAFLAILWFGVGAPLLDWHRERSELLQQRTALADRMEALLAARSALQQQAANVATGGSEEVALLEGDSDATASASLQELLQATVARVGVELSTVETMPGEDVGGYRRIRLRVAFTASWQVLVSLLKDLDTARPALLIDELQVQPALHRMSTAPGSFDVTCGIFALRTRQAQAAAR